MPKITPFLDRLLIFAGVGAFGLMALLFESCRTWPWEPPVPVTWRRRAAVVLLVLHGPVAAAITVFGASVLPLLGGPTGTGAAEAPGGPGVTDQTFVFVNGNDFPVVYTHIVRTAMGEPAPRRMAQLAPLAASRLRREDRQTLVIAPTGGFLAARGGDRGTEAQPADPVTQGCAPVRSAHAATITRSPPNSRARIASPPYNRPTAAYFYRFTAARPWLRRA